MWRPLRQLRSAQCISRLNESSNKGHDGDDDDDDDEGMSLWDDADGSAPAGGETQSQTLVFEGSRLKWMPCTGSGELAIISGIIEENLPHRKASDLDPSSLSLRCLRTVGGTEMQLRRAISSSR